MWLCIVNEVASLANGPSQQPPSLPAFVLKKPFILLGLSYTALYAATTSSYTSQNPRLHSLPPYRLSVSPRFEPQKLQTPEDVLRNQDRTKALTRASLISIGRCEDGRVVGSVSLDASREASRPWPAIAQRTFARSFTDSGTFRCALPIPRSDQHCCSASRIGA